MVITEVYHNDTKLCAYSSISQTDVEVQNRELADAITMLINGHIATLAEQTK